MGDEKNLDVTAPCEIFGSPEASDPQGSEVKGLPHTRGQDDRARSTFGSFWLLVKFFTCRPATLIVTVPQAHVYCYLLHRSFEQF